jgi:putative addiction module CopG family antidote
MAFALAKENERFIERMVQQGRFNNQSEVVREALRRMERDENAYLNPSPLTPEEARRSFAPDPVTEREEHALVRAAQKARRHRLRRAPATFDEL